MAKLDSIYISGIRSYGINKEDAQSLEFHKPVTLFLGENGCGKTTILEAVRHALTGDFPFSAKSGGQTFVADPLLYRQQSVKGCIKLKFRDIYGNPATILRVLKLEVVNKKYKCQAQDASYTYVDRDGVTRTRNVKLADCKEMINMLVGISESVLSNVLFCHQEDSLWPLSEDGNVKKKFDLIFDSSKFDRAVDYLTKDIKRRNMALKNLYKELTYLSEMKTAAQQKRTSLRDKEESLRLYIEEIKSLQQKYQPAKEKFQEIEALEASIQCIRNTLSQAENRLASNREIQANMKTLLKSVFQGTDEELEDKINNFHEVVKKKKEKLESVNKNLRDFANIVRENTNQESYIKSGLSALQEQIKQHNVKVRELRELFQGFDVSSEESVSSLEEVREKIKSEEKNLKDIQKECEGQESSLEEALRWHQKRCIEEESAVSLKNHEKKAAVKELEALSAQLENLSKSNVEFKKFQDKIKEVEDEILKEESTFNEADVNQEIIENKRTMRSIAEAMEKSESDLKILTSNEMITVQMEGLSKDKKAKESEIYELRARQHHLLRSLFPETLPSNNIVDKLNEVRRSNETLLSVQKKKVVEMEKKCSDFHVELQGKKLMTSKMRSELEAGRKSIERICKMEEFEAKCTAVGDENKKLQKEKGVVSAYRVIYKDFAKNFGETKCCPVCETDFNGNNTSISKISDSMNDRIKNLPTRLASVTELLEKGEALHNDLMQLGPVYKKITAMEEEVEFEEDMSQVLEGQLDVAQKELEQMRKTMEATQSTLGGCAKLAPDATLLDRNADEIERINKRLETLDEQIVEVNTKHTKMDMEKLIKDYKSQKTKLEQDNELLSRKVVLNQRKMHSLRTQKAKLNDDQIVFQRLVRDKPALILKQTELEKKIAELGSILEEKQNDLKLATENVREARLGLATNKAANAKKVDSAKQTLNLHKAQVHAIVKLSQEVKAVEELQLERKGRNMEDDIHSLQKKRAEIEAEGKLVNAERDLLKDELRDQDSMEKSLKQNRELREHMKKEQEIVKTIAAIREEIGSKDYNSLEAEKITLMKELNFINTEKATIEGKITALKINIEEISNELALFKNDPVKTYLAKQVEIVAEKNVIQNLKCVNEGLSVAICKYHKQQLLAINLRLRDLWRSIYKGNDINYIQIESGETQMGATRRQYTYCVMQKKGEVMMPMRGKCSAGQKVLACLLVRIVLAEHFSAQCGIFALDEPTTNLDAENVRSLSQAIAGLVNNHRMQKNFQFLVITHDESFLDALRESDSLKEFYRIKRNIKGNTFLTKEDI